MQLRAHDTDVPETKEEYLVPFSYIFTWVSLKMTISDKEETKLFFNLTQVEESF